MSYIDLINKFWNLDYEKRFSQIETRLFFLLLNYFNNRHWKGAVSLSNRRLKDEIPCSLNGFKNARKNLIKRGLIYYSNGNKSVSGKYFINTLYRPDTSVLHMTSKKGENDSIKNHASEDGPNHGGEHGSKHGINHGIKYEPNDSTNHGQKMSSYIREEKMKKKNEKEMENEE